MANEADKYVDGLRLALANAMYKGSVVTATEASENFAPKGPTLQLSRGIRAMKPFIDAQGNVVGIVISQARSKGGYNYADKQHNQELRHVSRFPLQSWFGDGQTGKTMGARYAKGYYKLKDTAPKFATKYLEEGLNAARDRIISMLEAAARSA